jgi:hypothetical protein
MTENLATPDVIDAEFTVNETAITLVPAGNETPLAAVTRALATVKAINTLIDKTFVEGIHYGKIPGVDRKILFLPGLEYAMSLLQLRDEYVEVSVVRNFEQHNPFFYYELECRLYTIGTNIEVGRGVGACNSRERIFMRSSKQKCPICDKETINRSKFPPKTGTDKTPGWYCHSKAGGCGAEFPYSEPTLQNHVSGSVFDAQLVWDNSNNIVKKAKKRALGDAIKRVAMLSERFTVDLDDHMVYDDAEIGGDAAKKPESVAPASASGEKPAQSKMTQFPESGKQATKPSGDADPAEAWFNRLEKPADTPAASNTPKAWHEDIEALKKVLGECRAEGWIEGDTIGKLKASFASLVGSEITSFETIEAASKAAEEAATKAKEANAKSGEAWDTFEGVQAIVTWAKGMGFGDNEPALIALLGKDWKAFADGRSAKEAIEEAFKAKQAMPPAENISKKTKLTDIDMLAISEWVKTHFGITASVLVERVDLSKCSTIATAKTVIRGDAREQGWPVMTEQVTYTVKKDGNNGEKKSLRFETVLGEISYFKGRTEFSKVVGEGYANDNGIPELPANEANDIEPLLLTWKARENYNEVVDAIPVLEPELA